MLKHILFSLSSLREISSGKIVTLLIAAMAIFISPASIYAQETLQPGEAYATRFSGVTVEGGTTIIDINGAVGSIIDIRSPGEPPKGQNWRNAPQRKPVTASEVGQVFGVTLDDASPPNIYLTATSAYGLHRNADNSDWMRGMWGSGGGPGTVWKLSAANDYAPGVFSDIKLNGRVNTGAALGNIAYDKWNRQLYVSDLESGMIHRLDLSDGRELGYYDHGAKGRKSFIDATTGKQKSLKTSAFTTTSKASTSECHEGSFEKSPACWNFADFRRRVWGLGVRKDRITEEVRLFYSVWGSHGFGEKEWAKAGDDWHNAIWSVKIAPDGSFDTADIKREFFLPDFFVGKKALERFGPSHPVSDIAFEREDGQNIMLLAERGGVRNLGLKNENAFSSPHEARVLRYELDSSGIWQFQGRYDVGFYDRNKHGQPYLRANSSGGVDFGYGYTEIGDTNLNEPDNTVWMTGDALCSPAGKCFSTLAGEYTDASQVHGLQGSPEGSYSKGMPDGATQPYPGTGAPYPATGLEKSIMIDTDINVDAIGKPIKSRISRNDATGIGDVEIYAPSEVSADAATPGVSDYPSSVIPVYPTGPGYPTTPSGGSKWGGGTPPPSPPSSGGKSGKKAFDLKIEKVHSGAPCAVAGTCTYDITIKNVGTVPYTGPINVTDTLPSGWDVAGAGVGANWTCILKPKIGSGVQIDCSYPATNLMPGQSVKMKLVLKVPANAKPGEVQNCAVLSYTPGKDKSCVKTKVKSSSKPKFKIDFKLEKKKSGKSLCQNNGQCIFKLTITNVGANSLWPSSTLFITDNLPSGWTFFGYSPGPPKWTCSGSGSKVICGRAGAPIQPGKSETLFITANVPPYEKRKTVKNCAKLKLGAAPGFIGFGPNDDDDPKNDHPCIDIKLKHVDLGSSNLPGGSGALMTLQLIKTSAGQGKCKRNGICSYKIDVKNVGYGDYQGPITVEDKILQFTNLKLVGYSPNPPWKCQTTSLGRVRCTHPTVTLKPGKRLKQLRLDFHLPAKLPKMLSAVKNCARITATGMGSATPWSCAKATISVLPQPDLEIKKLPEGGKCEQTYCNYKITIKNTNATPYKGPIYIYDYIKGKPAKIDFYGPKPDWSCARSGFIPSGNMIFCSHKPVTLNKNDSVTLTIRLQYPLTAVQVTNCTGIRWPLTDVTNDKAVFHSVMTALRLLGYYKGDKDGTIPSVGPDPDLSNAINDYLMQEWNLTGSGKITPQLLDMLFPNSSGEAGDGYPANDGPVCISTPSPSEVKITGKTDWGKAFSKWLVGPFGPLGPGGMGWWGAATKFGTKADGTMGCVWPHCSFFEFTATHLGGERYSGPLSMRIMLPPGTDFPKLRVTKSGGACPAAGWSCQNTGDGYMCRHSDCTLTEGEQVAIRVDGTLLPGMTEPPRMEMKKTACADVEWQVPSYKVFDIEQLGGKRMSRACFTTTVFAGEDPASQEVRPEPYDLALQKWGPEECMADGVCLYKIMVTNQGPGIFEAPLTIIDEGVRGWELLGGFPSPPWRCTRIDSGFKCDGGAALAPGNFIELLLELKVPALSNETPREVENCARIEWTETDRGEVSEDLNPGNDVACTMTFIKGLRGEMAPPAEPGPGEPGERDCPRGERWDSIERTCISIEKPHKTAPASCPPGQHWDGRRCVCEEGMRWDRGSRRCVPHKAEPGLHPCPPGMHRPRNIGNCVCMPGHHRAGNECIKCPRGHEWKEGRCIPPKARQPQLQRCPPGMHRRGERGACVCMPGHNRAGNQCIKCPPGHEWKEGRCISPKPKAKQPKAKQPQWQRCPPGMHRRGGRGACVCMPGHNRAGNQCIKCPPKHKWVPQRQKCERIVE